MKFLVITNHSYMLWQFRRELISALLERGEVVISTPFVGHEDDFAAIGCRLIETQIDRRSTNVKSDMALKRAYKRMIREEKPDIVITYSIKPNIYAGRICRRLNVPYVANVQGLGTAFQKKGIAAVVSTMYRSALRSAKAVVFENACNAEEFIRRGICRREKIAVMNGAGVNLNVYSFQSYPTEERGIRFLFIGRIMREKGIEELFTAASELRKKYGDRVHFDIVGFFEDDYHEQVKQLEKEGVLTFHGFREDPKPFYMADHCVILPSYHEGMSNVLLEAAATGRAIIASDIPGCREAVDEGVSGLLCRSEDAQSLRSAIEKFINMSPDERAAMGEAGRRKMEREFDKDEVVRRTLAVILDGER